MLFERVSEDAMLRGGKHFTPIILGMNGMPPPTLVASAE